MNPPLPSRVTAAVAVLAAAVTFLSGCLSVNGRIEVVHTVQSPQLERLIQVFEKWSLPAPTTQPASDTNWPMDVAFPDRR